MVAQQNHSKAEVEQEPQDDIANKLEVGEKLATNLREASSLTNGTMLHLLSLLER